MNYFSDEQAEILNNHVKFMMSTNKFDFVIYFAKSYDWAKSNICKLSSYSFNPNRPYDNLIKFTSFDQLNNYIDKFFSSKTDFYNQFFIIKKKIESDPNDIDDPFFKSVDYLSEIFGNKLNDNFKFDLEKTLTQNQHMNIFNFVYKHNDENETDKLAEVINNGNDNPNGLMFYSDTLQENEKDYFRKQYKYHETFSNYTNLQIEQDLSLELFNYRYDFSEFNQVYDLINKFETSINDYLLPKFNEYETLKFGRNKQYINSLKEVIYKIIDNFTSKKIEFNKCNDTTNEPFRISFTHNNIRYADTDKIKKMVYAAMPDKTPNMLGSYFECTVSCAFKNPLSMQVKNSFMHKLTNYLINNNIRVEQIKLLDEGKITKPAEGISFRFICNNFENIGVNPIKFMIPKLGMKRC